MSWVVFKMRWRIRERFYILSDKLKLEKWRYILGILNISFLNFLWLYDSEDGKKRVRRN